MNPEKLPNSQNEQYDPNLDAQDEDVVSGGNNRLMYILGALILALVVGYIALPKGKGSVLASVTPTFVLDDAAVTATVPTAADSAAAGLTRAVTPQSKDETERKAEAAKDVAAVPSSTVPGAVVPGTPVTVAAAPVAAPVAASAAAPEPAPVAAPEPAAPTSVTMTGKIEDENGRPLAGATVMLKGSSKVASTDGNGTYSIEVPGGADNTLMYGYGGYEDTEIRARGTQPQNITLTPRAKTGKKRR